MVIRRNERKKGKMRMRKRLAKEENTEDEEVEEEDHPYHAFSGFGKMGINVQRKGHEPAYEVDQLTHNYPQLIFKWYLQVSSHSLMDHPSRCLCNLSP